jgi:hypothetical protein
VNGFPAWPLRLTFRGRRELPVKVENMMLSGYALSSGLQGTDRRPTYLGELLMRMVGLVVTLQLLEHSA